MNQARNALSAFGTYTDFYSAGGNPGYSVNTEKYDGSSWSEQNNLNTGRATSAASGSSTAGLYFAGQNPSRTGATEEWNNPSSTTKTISTD